MMSPLFRPSSGNRMVSTAWKHFLTRPSKSTISRQSLWTQTKQASTAISQFSSLGRTQFPLSSSSLATLDFSTATSTSSTPPSSSDEASKQAEVARIIRMIKADLVEADANHDGKIDADELKEILRKYPDIFSDHDVFEIGDLFYSAKGGESVSHEKFMQAITNTVEGKAEVDEEKGTHRRMSHGASHPLGLGTCSTEFMYGKRRGVYTEEELDVKLTHVDPKTTSDKIAKAAVGVVRFLFDTVSLWKIGNITQAKVLRRVIFLETVAGIPGFVAAMNRHFRSLRNFTRDGGMLNMFLDEANNERMHLLSFVRMRDPGMFMRFTVLASQAVVGTGFLILYAVAPHFCHRFVGYVEEEACHTYTTIIKEIETCPDDRDMAQWRTELAPKIARGYWHLGEDGTVLDMMYAIRADEAEHRDVNHVVSGLAPDQPNPLFNPEEKFDQVLKKYIENMLERGKN